MRNKFLINFIFVIVIDQITKAIFSPRDFLFFGIHLHLVKNYGLSFGLNFGSFINLFIIAAALIIFALNFPRNKKWGHVHWSVPFILAGAASNLIDRFYFGYVRDFIDLRLGFTFDLADVFIILGLILMLRWDNQESMVE